VSTATTRRQPTTSPEPALYVALELSRLLWKIGLTVGFGQKPRERNVRAGDLAALYHEIQLAKKRFDLDLSAPVYCCYEAGRDGF
jgi:transposase